MVLYKEQTGDFGAVLNDSTPTVCNECMCVCECFITFVMFVCVYVCVGKGEVLDQIFRIPDL